MNNPKVDELALGDSGAKVEGQVRCSLLPAAVLLVACFVLLGSMAGPLDACVPIERFIRGDMDDDTVISIADPIALLNMLFVSGVSYDCDDRADVNDDGQVTIGDPIYLLSYLFTAGTPSPPSPFPACGEDPTFDSLGCWPMPSQCYPPEVAYVLEAPGGVSELIRVEISFFDSTITATTVSLPPPFDQTSQLEAHGHSLFVGTESGWIGRVSGDSVTDSHDVGASILAMTQGALHDELFIVTQSGPTIEAGTFDPYDGTHTVLWSTAEPIDIVDAAITVLGEIYLTGSTPTDSGFARVDSSGELQWIVSGAPGRLRYSQDLFVMFGVASDPGQEARVLMFDGDAIVFDSPIFGFVNPVLGDVSSTFDQLRIPFVDVGIVMGFNHWSTSPEVWLDPDDGITAPLDVTGY